MNPGFSVDNVTSLKGHIGLLISSLEEYLGYCSKQYPQMLKVLSKPEPRQATETGAGAVSQPTKQGTQQQGQQVIEASGVSTNYRDFFQLNSLGCVELKAGKYAAAIDFFTKALNKISQFEQDLAKTGATEQLRNEHISLASKRHNVVFNLALGHYQAGSYELAFKLLQKVVSQHQHNHFFWYRYAVCAVHSFLVQVETLCARTPNEVLEHPDNSAQGGSNREEAAQIGPGYIKRFFLKTDRLSSKVPKELLEHAQA